MGYTVKRRIEQPYMENGVEVHHPGELLDMDAPAELGGRVIVVEVPDPPPASPPAAAEAAGAGAATTTAAEVTPKTGRK
jgi:hypothetical protein